MDNNRNIILNILPQSEGAWWAIAIAVAVFSVASCAKTVKGGNDVEIARIEAAAHTVK
jgi:hypothetical protein